MKPIVSLIIPVYNVEKYLEKCLDSAINQTLKEIEIIIVNDGSTDGSLALCQKYADKDSRIKLISQKNRGLGDARNNGLLHAKGEFVCFLDSDDWLDRETLRVCTEQAENDQSEIVIFSFERIEESSMKVIQTRDDLEFDPSISKDEFMKRVFSGKLKLMACSLIAKRKLFVEHNLLFPSTLHEDLYVMPEIYFFANRTSIVRNHFYKWLVRSNSITNTISNKHIDGIVNAIYSLRIFMLRQHIFTKYEYEFALFSIRYLNLVLHRVNNYKLDQKTKKFLINEISFYATHLFDIKILKNIPKEELQGFGGIMSIINILENNSVSTLSEHELHKKNVDLHNQLYSIIHSRGNRLIRKYYHYRDLLLPKGSRRRKIVSMTVNKAIEYKNLGTKGPRPHYDVIFLPHKDYHAWTMGLIARELKKLGVSSCMIDITDYYRDEGSRRKAREFPEIPFIDYSLLRDDMINFDILVCMNDWDKKIVRPEVIKANETGKKTVGIVEGIQDFFDLDTKQKRNTYRSVEYVLLTGQHDQQFFQDIMDKTSIIGVPRLSELLKEPTKFPKKPLALINMNFSYGVLAEQAENWLKSAIEGCKLANIDYVITRHPADKTDLSDYNVTESNMYDAIRTSSIIISRFSSTILESLAMGKPVVYHNPHNERAIKFQDPLGAYSLSKCSNSLAKAIKYELSLATDYRERANSFLHYHCNINSKIPSVQLAASAIKKLTKKRFILFR